MTRILSLFVAFMLIGAMAFAQTRVVTGRVTNNKGAGIPNASIKTSGSTGTSADTDGSFSLKVTNESILTISSSGYESQTIKVGAQSFIDATLKSTNANIQEVVVTTTLGQVRQKAALGVATARVTATEITQGKSTNIAQGLTGKVSGVNIQQTNSGVNQTTRITLRGIRSLTGNNQPMLILDGVPISLAFFSSINPNDIADVTILKSATSTLVYGPDGVNGAVVVTTKKGSKVKPQITFSHSVQFEKVSFMPKFQTGWGSGYDQDRVTGEGTYTPYENQTWGDAFDGSIRPLGEKGPNGEVYLHEYSYKPNEKRNFFNTGLTNQTDISYNTGDFYLSAQNVSTKGTVPDDELSRRTITFKAEKEYNRFKAIFNVRYAQTKSNTTSRSREMMAGIYNTPGNVPLTQFKDWRNDYFSSPNGYFTWYIGDPDYTPYFVKDNNRRVGKVDDVFGNMDFKYKFSNSLNLVYRVGLSVRNDGNTQTTGAFQTSAFASTRPSGFPASSVSAAIAERSEYSNRLTSEAFLNYNTKYKSFDITALAGHSFRETRVRDLDLRSNNLGQSTFQSISTRLGEPGVTPNNSLQRLQRFFGSVALGYKKMIFVEGTASYDRDSRLVPSNKIFETKDISLFYSGVNTSILLHELIPGFKNNKVVNFLKVRGGIAKTGNVNIQPYQNDIVFGSAAFFPFGTTPGYQVGLNNTSITSYPGAGLKPEFVNTKEVGLEVGFLKNKVVFEANYYVQDNTNQILNVRLSNTTGATNTLLNAGSFQNKGLELDLKLTPFITLGDVSMDFKINYTNQKNKVTGLLDGVQELAIGNFQAAVVGSPAFVYKLVDYDRDPATGKVIVNAGTGMPKLNNAETQHGKTLPEHIVGMTYNLNWKNISLSIVGQYSTGNNVLSDDLGRTLDNNGLSQRSGDFGRRAFVFPNSVYLSGGKYIDNTNIITSSFGREFYNTALNTGALTNYLASGAFFKLREVSLTYTMPSSLFEGKAIKGATIGFSGRNLLMWLPKSNQWADPEFSSNANASNGGNATTGAAGFTGNATGRNSLANSPTTRFMGLNVSFQF
jgi:TonB-linked SusC/RagA family outer membrane protein